MSGDSAPRTDTVTVRVKSHPEHGLGFNIRGGTDCPHVPGDPGIFITRIRKEGAVAETKQIPEGARLLEIDGQSLIDVTHGQAVSMFLKAKEKKTEYIKLKFEKGAVYEVKFHEHAIECIKTLLIPFVQYLIRYKLTIVICLMILIQT